MKSIIYSIFVVLGRKEKKRLWQLAILDVCISVLDIAFLLGLLYLIRFYTQSIHSVSSSLFSMVVFDRHPLLLIAGFLLLFSAKNFFGFAVSKMEYRFVYKVAARISRDSLSNYLNGTYHDYVHVDSSVAHRKINQQPVEFAHYVLNGLLQVFSQTVLILITIAAIIAFDPLLFPLLLLILTPPLLLAGFLMKRKLHQTRLHSKATSEKAIQHLREALSGFIESNVYEKKDFFISRYDRYQSLLNHYLSGTLIIQNIPSRLVEVFAVLALFILVALNSFTTHHAPISLITAGALMVAAYKIIPGIVKITNTLSQIRTYAYTTKDPDRPASIHHDKYAEAIAPLQSVSFENVSFSYPGKRVLDHFSLHAKRGDMLAITGLSGKGKTTFINLLLGFLTPDSGNIHFNGNITQACDRQFFWNRIAYVKQQPFFLHASLRENITLEEAVSNEKILKRAVSIAGLTEVIRLLPHGLDTIITENGKNFSGGQRQRVSLARALYREADLLILDEPFSELDEASETQMLNDLRDVASTGKMILLITHNPNAGLFCNKKIAMNEVEQ